MKYENKYMYYSKPLSQSQLFPKRQNFRLFQILTICKPQNKCKPDDENCFGKGRKHCRKRRNRCLTACFFLFLTILSKVSFLWAVKIVRLDC